MSNPSWRAMVPPLRAKRVEVRSTIKPTLYITQLSAINETVIRGKNFFFFVSVLMQRLLISDDGSLNR